MEFIAQLNFIDNSELFSQSNYLILFVYFKISKKKFQTKYFKQKN